MNALGRAATSALGRFSDELYGSYTSLETLMSEDKTVFEHDAKEKKVIVREKAFFWKTKIAEYDAKNMVRDESLQHKLKGHSGWVFSVAFSPNGKRIVSGGTDRMVRIWDAETGQLQRELKGHGRPVRSVAFSPNGERVASGSQDYTVRIWDAATGQLQRELKGHSSGVKSVAFSPNGELVASGSDDNTVRIWDAATGQLQREPKGHGRPVTSVAFSPNGDRLASGCYNETVWIWSLSPDEYLLSLLPKYEGRVAEDAHELILKVIGDDEYAITQEMKTKNMNCDIVPMRRLDKHAFKEIGRRVAVVMRKMDSTLEEWRNRYVRKEEDIKTYYEQVDFIVGSIEKQMNCLLKVNSTFVYTDLKPNNVGIVFEKTSNAIQRVHLLNLGSALQNSEEKYFGTFPCVPWHKDGFFSIENEDIKSRCVYYQLYILIMSLILKEKARRWLDNFTTKTMKWATLIKDINRVRNQLREFPTITHIPRILKKLLQLRPRHESLELSPYKESSVFEKISGVAHVANVIGKDVFKKLKTYCEDSKSNISDTTINMSEWTTLITELEQNSFASEINGYYGTYIGKIKVQGRLGPRILNKILIFERIQNGIAVATFNKHGDFVSASADDVYGFLNAFVKKNMVRVKSLQHKLEGHRSAVNSVAFSPNGERVVSGSFDKTIRIWDAATRQLQRELKGHSSAVYSVAFSPNGARVASGTWDMTVRIWDAATGQLQRELKGHSSTVSSVAFSPSGKRVVSGGGRFDKTVRIWDAETGQQQQELKGHSSGVTSVAFSPNGERVASGSDDRTVRIWDAATGQLQRELKGHRDGVYSVAFSPNGARVASGSQDHTIRIWDVATGQLQRELKGHTLSVTSVAFSPNGERVASGSYDETVRIWSLPPDEFTMFKVEYNDPPFMLLGTPEPEAKISPPALRIGDEAH